MKKTLCLVVTLAMLTLFAGLASAENYIAGGVVWSGGVSTATFGGQLDINEKLSAEAEYTSIANVSEFDIYLKYPISEQGDGRFGVLGMGGIATVGNNSYTGYGVGLWGEQRMASQMVAYAKGGYVYVPSTSKGGFSAMAGVRAYIASPMFVAGEGLWSCNPDSGETGSAFRVKVGVTF